MGKGRMEAFSDGVLAIIITIMILELKLPHGESWDSLREIVPQLTGYVLSFLFIGIYWVNHHHLLQVVRHVSGGILWTNLNLLFWLSLIPFATNWMDESHFSTVPVVVYAVLLLLSGVAYTILQWCIMDTHHFSGEMKAAMDKVSRKGILSMIAYSCAIGMAYVDTRISCVFFLAVSIMWLVPERNIEQAMKDQAERE